MNVKQHLPFYNKWCVYILKHLEYTIPNVFLRRSLLQHLLIFAFSFIILFISWHYVGTIRTYVFLFHLLSLLRKWIILLFNKINCNITKNRNRYRTKSVKVISPYHKQFYLYTFALLFMAFLGLLSIMKIFGYDVLYSIVVYLSIVMTFLQELLEGMIVLYDASPKVDILQSI